MRDLHSRALRKMKNGQYSEALFILDQLKVSGQETPDILHDLAICHLHTGKPGVALQLLNQAVDLQPSYGYRYASRAYIKAWLRDFEGASADYREAIRLDPSDAISHNNLGLVEEQMGRAESAKSLFDRADELQHLLKENNIISASDQIDPPVNLQKQLNEESRRLRKENSLGATGKKLLRSAQERKNFFRFIINGFKIKD
jgi:tetratricopeptide (TPR) repeat protein